MENFLQQGIDAAKSGDKVRAFQLLTRATRDSVSAEQAWLWLAGVVTSDAERLFCLDSALRINPNNGAAKTKAAELRQKGIFPATPTPPSDPSSTADAPRSISPSPVPITSSSVQSAVPGSSSANQTQQDFSGIYRFAAIELAKKQPPKVVAKKLIDQGVMPDTANRIVAETHTAVRKALAEKGKKRMTRGLIWAVIGIVITCGTLAFASGRGGGSYVVFYGAIIYGVIDFIAGLSGWLSNR